MGFNTTFLKTGIESESLTSISNVLESSGLIEMCLSFLFFPVNISLPVHLSFLNSLNRINNNYYIFFSEKGKKTFYYKFVF